MEINMKSSKMYKNHYLKITATKFELWRFRRLISLLKINVFIFNYFLIPFALFEHFF